MFKKIDRRMFTLLASVFIQILGGSMVLPVLPLYAQRDFGLPPQVISLLVSSYFMALFIAGPTIGRLSDRYGRLPILIISQIGTVISFIMLGTASTAFMLFAARIIDGITGGNIIVAQAYVTDITPPGKRTEALGYIYAAFGLGFIFGPASGGILSALYGEKAPFIVAAVASAATVLLTWLALDESLTPEKREANRKFSRASLGFKEVVSNLPLVTILVIAFVGQFALGMVQATFALMGEAVYFAGRPENVTNLGVGLLLTVVGLTQFLTQTYLLRRLLNRFGDVGLLILGTTIRGLGLFIFALVTSPWLAGFGSLFFALGMGTAMPPLQSLATRTAADQVRGGVLGLYQSAISLSTIMSTALAGALFALHATIPYWLGGTLSLVVVVPALSLVRQAREGKLGA